MSERQRSLLVDSCLQRVQRRGHEHLMARGYGELSFLEQKGKPTPDMWSITLVRMITRGAWSSTDIGGDTGNEPDESTADHSEDGAGAIKQRDRRQEGEYRMRKLVFDYVISDFTSRFVLVVFYCHDQVFESHCLGYKPLFYG